MLPVCVMVPPPSPTFYCALFIYFVVFFLSWLLFSCSHRAIIVCVCVWLTLKMCWVFCLVRAPVHSLKLLTLLRKADISGARSIVWCRVKKSMYRKKRSRSPVPSLSKPSLLFTSLHFTTHGCFFCSISPLLLLFLFQLWRVICWLVLFVICCHRKCVLWILWLLKCRQQ